MSETENVEQGADKRVMASAWACNECGTAVEQADRPKVCWFCTRSNDRRGLSTPEPDFGPLYDAEIVVALLKEAYARGVADGERGSMRDIADLVAEVTK